MQIETALALIIMIGSFFLGFLACAMLTAGKVSDLENEIVYRKNISKTLDDKLDALLDVKV